MKYIKTTIERFINEQKEPNKIWYHGSDYVFDTFDKFQAKGSSALGIFVTDDKVLAEMFGSNVYNVNIKYLNPYIISMDKWDSIRDEHAKDTVYFTNMRNNLINKGYDSIFIKERKWQSSGGITFKDGNIVILFEKSQITIIQ